MKPLLSTDPVYEKQSADFRGYYNEPFGSVVRFKDMRNMSGDDAPIIRTRDPRTLYYAVDNLNGVFSRGDHLYWVSGNNLCDEDGTIGALASLATGTERTFVNMGAYTVIMPDKKLFCPMEDGQPIKDIEGKAQSLNQVVTFTDCDIDGNALPAGAVAVYSKALLPSSLDMSGFKAGDVVRFQQWNTAGTQLAKDHGYYQLIKIVTTGANAPWVVIIKPNDISHESAWTDGPMLKVERLMPDMDFITENNNRLWGCSSANHEVYACALGDPTNWRTYQGLATDSWAATVGGDGDFTGAATHMGTVLFFKQNEIIKIYGDKPANFQIVTQKARGVQKNCAKSLCTMDENLYYLSEGRMVRYSGAWPEDVSMAWGSDKMCMYGDECASGAGFGKVWTSVSSPELGTRVMMVYDGRTGHWHVQNEIHLPAGITGVGNQWFVRTETAMYFAQETELGGQIWKIYGHQEGTIGQREDPRDILSYIMTGDLEMDVLEQLRVQKVMVRVMVGPYAECTLYVAYDNDKDRPEDIGAGWETIAHWTGDTPGDEYDYDKEPEELWRELTTRNAEVAYIVPRRCDHFRLAIVCTGLVKIMRLNYIYKPGTEIRIK